MLMPTNPSTSGVETNSQPDWGRAVDSEVIEVMTSHAGWSAGLEFALPADEIVSMTDTTVGTGKAYTLHPKP
jgi:hypothetical protein